MYIDDTIMNLPTQELKVRLNEMQEAIRVLKHFGGIK